MYYLVPKLPDLSIDLFLLLSTLTKRNWTLLLRGILWTIKEHYESRSSIFSSLICRSSSFFLFYKVKYVMSDLKSSSSAECKLFILEMTMHSKPWLHLGIKSSKKLEVWKHDSLFEKFLNHTKKLNCKSCPISLLFILIPFCLKNSAKWKLFIDYATKMRLWNFVMLGRWGVCAGRLKLLSTEDIF